MHARRPDLPAVWTIRDIVSWGKEFFTSKGIDEARLTIELMVCAVLSVRRIELYTDHDRPLTKDELARLREMVQRRVKHEPLQYIIGTADFYGLTYEVGPAVLIPRPETEILVDRVIRFCDGATGRLNCLDVGTGSGIIPIAVSKGVLLSWWTCMDISDEALRVAHNNAVRHGVEDRLMFVHGDFQESIPAGGPWDVITMNPPYIAESDIAELDPDVREFEPKGALTDGADGLTFFRRLAGVLPEILTPSGKAFLEIGYGQADSVTSMFTDSAFHVDVVPDLAGLSRVVVVSKS